MTYDLLIIGAGVAGLTAALHVAEHGLRPLVLEADPEQPGGRLKGGPPVTLEQGGQTWHFPGEHGVHGIWSPYRNLQALLVRHNLRPVLVPARQEDWILGHGRTVRRAEVGSAIRTSWIPAPLHYLGLFARPRFLALLGLRDWAVLPRVFVSLLAALSIDPLEEGQPLAGMTLADFCHRWSPNLTGFFTGLTRNALPARLEEIPASGFIAFLRFYTLRRRDAWAFSYLPSTGGQTIMAPLVATLRALGGELRLGTPVRRLERLPTGWRALWDGGSAEAEQLILAVDAPAAATLLRASPATAAEATRLQLPEGKATAIFRLWFDRAPARPRAEAGIFSGDFILDNFFWLHRLYDEYIRWARATGGSALEAHLYGPPELLALPDATLLAQAILDVGRAWPELRQHLLHATLTRNPPTHTLLRVGRPEEHLGVLTPWPGLFCCGDWVRDPSPTLFLERACVTGILAANAALVARDRPPWPLLLAPPPEPLAAALELWMASFRRSLRQASHRQGPPSASGQ